jgi:hypothetical protein
MERTDTDPRDGDESVAAQPINLPLALVFTDMVGSSAAKRAASLGGSSVDRDAAFGGASRQRDHDHRGLLLSYV